MSVSQDTGRYVFSAEQVKILETKIPGYIIALKKAKYTSEVFDEVKGLPAFVQPEGWKYSVTRWLDNHAKPKRKASGEVSNSKSPNPRSPSVNPGEGGGIVGTDGAWKLKALTRLFNKLVNGVLTLPTGREAFGEAHAAMISRTMSETNDYDPERILDKLWDAVSPKNKEEWEETAKKESVILENQAGFTNGLWALIQSCLQSGYLGRAGVAVFLCFEKDSSVDSKPVSETSMVNEWWDPDVSIPENDMLLSGEFDSLDLATAFPIDEEGNARFPVVDTDDLKGSEARTILSDWYRKQWVQSGHRGPIRYTEFIRSPDQFYDQDDLPFGMKIADPTDKTTTSSAEVQVLFSHFMANFGIAGRAFSFKAPREPSEDPTTPMELDDLLSSGAMVEDKVDIVNDEGGTDGEEVPMEGTEQGMWSGGGDEPGEEELDEEELDEEESDSDEDSDSDSEHGEEADTEKSEKPPAIAEGAREQSRSNTPSLPRAMTPWDMPSVDGKDQAMEPLAETQPKAWSEERTQQPNRQVSEPILVLTSAEVVNTVKTPVPELQAIINVDTPSPMSPTDGIQQLDGQAHKPQVFTRAETVDTLETTTPEVQMLDTIITLSPESPKQCSDGTPQLDGQASKPLLASMNTENVKPANTPSPAQFPVRTTTGPVESMATHPFPAVEMPSAERIPVPASDIDIPAQSSKKRKSKSQIKSCGTKDQEVLGVSQSDSAVKKPARKPRKGRQTAAEQGQPETPGKKRKRDQEEGVQGSGIRRKKSRTQQPPEPERSLTAAPEVKTGKPSYDYVWEPANKKGSVQMTPKKDTVEGRVTTRRQLAQVAP
ncbi:hypothetical protein V5O48_012552 [Marasmius crinis-equi]|uniref:Uncharacterized protein n=1 Tax=Marasmius crinis-equi TaxID=585013 RepID=A0ABR3F2H4_9AGAR